MGAATQAGALVLPVSPALLRLTAASPRQAGHTSCPELCAQRCGACLQGETRVALYGIGNLRDERLGRMFQTPGCVEW